VGILNNAAVLGVFRGNEEPHLVHVSAWAMGDQQRKIAQTERASDERQVQV
jgi:hypothetical protein